MHAICIGISVEKSTYKTGKDTITHGVFVGNTTTGLNIATQAMRTYAARTGAIVTTRFHIALLRPTESKLPTQYLRLSWGSSFVPASRRQVSLSHNHFTENTTQHNRRNVSNVSSRLMSDGYNLKAATHVNHAVKSQQPEQLRMRAQR